MERSKENPWGKCEKCGREGTPTDDLDEKSVPTDWKKLCFACAQKTPVTAKYAIFQGVLENNRGCRFFSMARGRTPGELAQMDDGTVAYEIIGYADNVHDAQVILYGSCYSHCRHPDLYPNDCHAS